MGYFQSVFLAVWDVAKEADFSLATSGILNHELHAWGVGEGWENSR